LFAALNARILNPFFYMVSDALGPEQILRFNAEKIEKSERDGLKLDKIAVDHFLST
jgi:hypothetical protein